MADPNPGKLAVIWTPDPPAPGHTAGMVRTATAAIDHPDPLGLLSDALAEGMSVAFGKDRPAQAALDALVDVLEARRTYPSPLDDDEADDVG
jgi:hypothetical protein